GPGVLAPRGGGAGGGWPFGHREYFGHLVDAGSLCAIGPGSFGCAESARRRTLAPFPPLSDFEPVVLRFSPPARFGVRYRSALETDAHMRCILLATCLWLRASENGSLVTLAVACELARHHS